jgi:hypothetical protein
LSKNSWVTMKSAPGVDLGLEVVHLLHAVGGAGVALGEAGDADAEAAAVGVAGFPAP